jgi:hypothetical protein
LIYLDTSVLLAFLRDEDLGVLRAPAWDQASCPSHSQPGNAPALPWSTKPAPVRPIESATHKTLDEYGGALKCAYR